MDNPSTKEGQEPLPSTERRLLQGPAPYERPADSPGAIVLDYLTFLALPLFVSAAGVPRSVYGWLPGLMVLGLTIMAGGLIAHRRRGRAPANVWLGALSFDSIAAALLLWLNNGRIAVREPPYALLVGLLAAVGALYAYSMIRMPRRAARAWSPIWGR